ncbi:hypothetical protein QW180_03140 [Vibrio sinaloensis]|nr:hypothetical protein [Vibrio sinaloensis]
MAFANSRVQAVGCEFVGAKVKSTVWKFGFLKSPQSHKLVTNHNIGSVRK